MRIMHAPDAHVDANRHGRINPATGRSTAIESNRACFAHVIDQTLELAADALVLPGDIWDTGRPAAEHIAFVAEQIHRLTREGIAVIAEDGNHGRHGVRVGDRGPVALLSQAGAHVYNSIGVLNVETKSGPLSVLTVPWPERARLLHEAGLTDLTDPTAVDEALAGYVATQIEDAMEDADLAPHVIAASHITITDASLRRGSETVVNTRGIFEEVTLPLETFVDTGVQYVALGHIHHAQDHGIASYAGSLNRLTFGEADDRKGALLVDLTDEGPVRTVIDTPARAMVNLRLDKTPDPDLSILTPGALVKAHLAPGERAVPEAIRNAIKAADATLVRTQTKPAVVDPSKARVTLDENVDPMIALARWADTRDLDDAARADLTARARLVADRCTH